MLLFALKFIFIMGQLYWRLMLKDDKRDEVIWNACLLKGDY